MTRWFNLLKTSMFTCLFWPHGCCCVALRLLSMVLKDDSDPVCLMDRHRTWFSPCVCVCDRVRVPLTVCAFSTNQNRSYKICCTHQSWGLIWRERRRSFFWANFSDFGDLHQITDGEAEEHLLFYASSYVFLVNHSTLNPRFTLPAVCVMITSLGPVRTKSL